MSNYYLADEIAGNYRGMMIALPAAEWEPFGGWDVVSFAQWLVQLVRQAKLSRFRKHPRGPKKPRSRRTRFTREKHISTAKLLLAEKKKKKQKKRDP